MAFCSIMLEIYFFTSLEPKWKKYRLSSKNIPNSLSLRERAIRKGCSFCMMRGKLLNGRKGRKGDFALCYIIKGSHVFWYGKFPFYIKVFPITSLWKPFGVMSMDGKRKLTKGLSPCDLIFRKLASGRWIKWLLKVPCQCFFCTIRYFSWKKELGFKKKH